MIWCWVVLSSYHTWVVSLYSFVNDLLYQNTIHINSKIFTLKIKNLKLKLFLIFLYFFHFKKTDIVNLINLVAMPPGKAVQCWFRKNAKCFNAVGVETVVFSTISFKINMINIQILYGKIPRDLSCEESAGNACKGSQ